ncbi:l-2-gd1 [Drosophila busckii]|uniref:L-2-gd1 n=1 Tax=Drosophila busckii TaxID=30019 RepID=A0A0M5J8X1_DROBS|nr:l-2-gd1 [Drosophila busckii]
MFSRKKPEPPKRRQHDLSQFGLTDIPDDFDPSAGYGDDDAGDSDLEAELAAIASGGRPKPKPQPKPQLLPSSDLDKMIADSLRDVTDDEDDEALEHDSELLGELQGITGVEEEPEEPTSQSDATPAVQPEPVQTFLPTTTVDTLSIIKQRLEMYKIAEAQAKAAGEAGKARRFARGLKTLQDLHKQSAAGKAVNVDDIPPEVSVKPAGEPAAAAAPVPEPAAPLEPKQPIRAAPSPPTPSTPSTPATPTQAAAAAAVNPLVANMRGRQSEYKAAAVQAKRNGDTAAALQFLRVVKQFDVVVKMCEDGQEVDLSDMPPPPAEFMAFMAKMQESGGETPKEAATQVAPAAPVAPASAVTTAPGSMAEALQQRLDKYKSVEESAKAENNTSKARRFGRIVKQYEDAIKQYKAGKPVAYDELPVPPGFGPLPTADAAPAATPKSPTSPPATASTSAGDTPNSSNAVTPTAPRKAPATPPSKELTTRTSGNHQKNNLAEQQMKLLLERQQEFKAAAITAKKAGEMDQAKEYLKIYKGFESLLNAASSGLPVDLSTLPLPPSQRDNLEASFAIVSAEECDPNDDICEIGVRMEEQLAKQLMMCKNTRDHHKAMGDVAGMNRFENLALTVQKDLDLVRYTKRKNQTLPKFHYEKRSFNIVHCNTDLTDNELEIVVEETFKTKTNVIKDTDSPDYDERFKVDIQRGNRQFQRIFKRHGVKFEIYSRGGFLRSDTLIGTVNVKLQPLETKCDIHDTYDLMDGRKQVGGKLEIKVRVRNPILTKQMEHINEKWLVLDA